MKKNYFYYFIFSIVLFSCSGSSDSEDKSPVSDGKPKVSNNGELIEFEKFNPIFKTEVLQEKKLEGAYMAPATIVASILSPSRAEANPIILFEDPELNELYSSYLQSLAHYKRDLDFLERVKDMYTNKASTGRELKEAETGVTDAATELAEKEGRFRMLGFNPQELTNASVGSVWLIANVPENVISSLAIGKTCGIQFTSFPSETFTGQITAIGDVLDAGTRTLKVRILLTNSNNRFKSGMYAQIQFMIDESSALSVPVSSIISVQGKDYVFRKEGNKLYRVEVILENQIGNNVIILKGVKTGDEIVKEGTMLLKGLSFGY